MSEELKPCPFCGGKAIKRVTEEEYDSLNVHCTLKVYHVTCTKCGADMRSPETRPEFCETLWNRRTQQPNEPLTLEQLKQMDGEPVWIGDPLRKELPYCVVSAGHNSEALFLTTGDNYGFCSYGKTWLAYRRPPEAGEKE